MPPTKYDLINDKLGELKDILLLKVPIIDEAMRVASENSRILKGSNGTKGIDTRLSIIEQDSSEMKDIKNIARDNAESIRSMKTTLDNHITDEKDKQDKREKMVNSLILLLVGALITNIGTILTTGILFYLNWK